MILTLIEFDADFNLQMGMQQINYMYLHQGM